MYRAVDAVEIHVWGRKVGAVALDKNLRYYVFEYEPKFIREGIELAPLAMPLAEARSPFVFMDLPELTYKRLPALLADALPDDFGNTLIDSWMARQGLTSRAITALDRLAYMGKRGMGALEFRPARGPTAKTCTALSMSALVENARSAVHGELTFEHSTHAALAQIIKVGTSAGGARAKAVVAWNAKTQEIRTGQFDVDPGFEHWLLKFDGMGKDRELGGSQDYGRIEYAYSKMATAAGITISPCTLLTENGRAHFMTKRFDRDGNRKYHIQTLCAMAHLDYKQKASHDYNQLFQTIDRLRLEYTAKEEAFRRMAFNVMAANCDDHTKNISFILREGEEWRLAPAYDVTFAHNPEGDWTNQHLMSVNGKFTGVTRNDLLKVADRFQIGTARHVLKQVGQAVKEWSAFAEEAHVSPVERDRIRKYHQVL